MKKSTRKMLRKPESEKRSEVVRVMSDLANRLRDRAKAENRTVSTMIMLFIERGLHNGQ
jgi:hypothetical protein